MFETAFILLICSTNTLFQHSTDHLSLQFPKIFHAIMSSLLRVSILSSNFDRIIIFLRGLMLPVLFLPAVSSEARLFRSFCPLDTRVLALRHS